MQQAASQQAQHARRRRVLASGPGAAMVTAGITAVLLAGNPAPSTTPAETAPAPAQIATTGTETTAPDVKACQNQPLIELASVENGGSGMIRFRKGDFASQMMVLNDSPQPIVFPGVRDEGFPLKETITIEGSATNLVLGAEGDHFIIPRVDGSYSRSPGSRGDASSGLLDLA
jgi:hypothetical protein